MRKNKNITVFLGLFFFLFLLFLNTSSVNASIIDDIKFLLSDSAKNKLTLDSKIEHAPNGDLNKDGKFNSGETVRFIYTVNNPTDKEISFATLKTNIAKENVNFIHNIKGATNLSDKNKTITIPNLRINPGEKLEISFNARINFLDSDKIITTEPEIITSDKKSLLKSKKKEITAKKIMKSPSSVESRKK